MPWIDDLFKKMVEVGASDLHLTTDVQPMFRVDGEMRFVDGCPALSGEQTKQVLFEIAPERNQKEFEEIWDSDFAYALEGVGRFRANYFWDRRGPSAVFRLIPDTILTADQLGLPKAVMDFCYLTKGLVVVTGPTGSGKSTTLAAMVDHINKTRGDHIITIEDPIEFQHENQRCLVNQREVHRHTASFKGALRSALREDPDIVLVGEMRDLETIEIALETAETGHLVFGTLHTTTAPSTVDRIIDQFPADRQQQIRVMLAASLKGVVAQTLCKRTDKGRVAALEVLVVNSAVAANIRDGKTHQIPSLIQTGGKLGMRSMTDALLAHAQAGIVSPEEAYLKAVQKQEMEAKLRGAGLTLDLEHRSEEADAFSAPAPDAPLPADGAGIDAPPSPAGSGVIDDFESFKRSRQD